MARPAGVLVVAAGLVMSVSCGGPFDGERAPLPPTPADPSTSASIAVEAPRQPASPAPLADPAPPPPPAADPLPVVDRARDAGAGPTPDASESGYDRMCRHYCRTLEETLTTSCLVRGSDAATCGARHAGTAETCFQVRCVPHLVDPATCLRQCDALEINYDALCAAPAPGAPCPSSPVDHDSACRLGCAP